MKAFDIAKTENVDDDSTTEKEPVVTPALKLQP